MNLVFYSTCSTVFDGNTFHYANTPLCKEKLETISAIHSDWNITVVSQLPGMFLLDLEGNNLKEKSQNINYIILPQKATSEEISQKILQCSPDTAVSITGFFRPYDWQGIKDAQIAEQLIKNGIKVICNSAETQEICFDKNLTQAFLEKHNFNVPASVSSDYQLYWAERNHKELLENVYKSRLLSKLQKMNYPLIIKDVTGLSSFGMEVVTTFNQAKAFLDSKKNNGNKIIQELIEGQQFGIEVFGTPGNYVFSPLLQFSVNQYKITSPKQSVKAGPVTAHEYKIEDLKEEILRLCELLKINGSAQIDLVFDGNAWFIIEINPRLSGMTNTVCKSLNTNYFKLLTACITGHLEQNKADPVLSLKLPLIDSQIKNKLLTFDFIKQINQTQNDAAKQQRENGYCEIIITDTDSIKIKEDLNLLKVQFAELIDEGFYTQAIKLLEDI